MKPSLIPLLFALQCAFLLWRARQARGSAGALPTAVGIVLLLLLWGLASAGFALSGVYDDPRFLALMPGLWLPGTPLLLVGALLLIPSLWTALVAIIDSTPQRQWLGIQALRIAAIGTLIKTQQGTFPVHVELAIGLTDIVFGISALILFRLTRRRELSADAAMIFHVTGMLLILVPGLLAIQLGLPGPLQEFSATPTAEVMLDFPMVLAPTLVVPCFLMLNICGLLQARRRHLLDTANAEGAKFKAVPG